MKSYELVAKYEAWVASSLFDTARNVRSILSQWQSPYTGDTMRALALNAIKLSSHPKIKIYDNVEYIVYDGIILDENDKYYGVVIAEVKQKSDLVSLGAAGYEYYLTRLRINKITGRAVGKNNLTLFKGC